MSTKRQRERFREQRIAYDLEIAEGRLKTADLSEERAEPIKSSTTKKKSATPKKRASRKAKE